MKYEHISLTDGPNGPLNRQMYKALVDSMEDKERFVFLCYQVVLGIEHLYPQPADLLDTALLGKDFVALKLPVDVIGYIIKAFNESLPAEARGAAAESFITNVFIKGIGQMLKELSPGNEKHAWMKGITDRLKEMADIKEK